MFPFTLELEPSSQLETKGAQCSQLLSLSGQTQGRAGRARFPLPSRNRSPISLLCRPVLWFSIDVSNAFGLKEYWCCQPGPLGPLRILLAAALCRGTSAAWPHQPLVLAVCGFWPLCGLGFTSLSSPKVTDTQRDPGGFELLSRSGCDACLSASLPGLAACAGCARVGRFRLLPARAAQVGMHHARGAKSSVLVLGTAVPHRGLPLGTVLGEGGGLGLLLAPGELGGLFSPRSEGSQSREFPPCSAAATGVGCFC